MQSHIFPFGVRSNAVSGMAVRLTVPEMALGRPQTRRVEMNARMRGMVLPSLGPNDWVSVGTRPIGDSLHALVNRGLLLS